MRSGLRNAEVRVEPGGEVSERGMSRAERVCATKSTALSAVGRMAPRWTLLSVVAESANSTSQSYADIDDNTDSVPRTARVSSVP